MARVRINFAISDEMYYWIKSQPNIDSVTREWSNMTIVEHHMSGAEAQTMKTAFMDKLIEAI